MNKSHNVWLMDNGLIILIQQQHRGVSLSAWLIFGSKVKSSAPSLFLVLIEFSRALLIRSTRPCSTSWLAMRESVVPLVFFLLLWEDLSETKEESFNIISMLLVSGQKLLPLSLPYNIETESRWWSERGERGGEEWCVLGSSTWADANSDVLDMVNAVFPVGCVSCLPLLVVCLSLPVQGPRCFSLRPNKRKFVDVL